METWNQIEMPSSIKRRFRYAAKAAHESTFSEKDRFKTGAALFKSGRLISFGRNIRRSHTIVDKYTIEEDSRMKYVTIHAELDCVLGIEKNLLKDGTIFVWRASGGSPRIAKPCLMCQDILKQVGVKKAYFTTTEFPFFDEMEIV